MKNKTFLVALHARNFDQCMVEVGRILTPNGAHGLIVVNNDLHVAAQPKDSLKSLFDIAIAIKNKFPKYLVGINPLEMKNHDALFEFKKTPLDILWVDNGGINESGQKIDLNFKVAKELESFDFSKQQYFGCIDFKYQKQVIDLPEVAKFSAQKFGCVITSGETTGQAPSLGKIQTIRGAVGGDTLVGIASGMTAENVGQYLAFADIFIVGTSLLVNKKDPFIYDEDLVKAFRLKIEEFKK